MYLSNIEKNPKSSLIYLERYVNDGSPSGFTEKNNSSFITNPYHGSNEFKIYSLIDVNSNFKIYGFDEYKHNILYEKFYIHPDMINHIDLKNYDLVRINTFSVSPTSSSRTVSINSKEYPGYIKLHYDGTIGRINRKLQYKKAINGVQISQIIKEAISRLVITPELSILHEPFAKSHINFSINDPSNYWSWVFREYYPFGNRSNNIKFQIPLFSLWSIDRNARKNSLILEQLVEKWKHKAKDIMYQNIVEPIIKIYFELIIKLGLQSELNAQNILIGFDVQWTPISIIIRDMMGIEKDLDIIKENNLIYNFDSEYKNIYEGMGKQKNLYQKRHSFAFDFKLSHYVIKPIIDIGQKLNVFSDKEAISCATVISKYYLKQLPDNYLPYDSWYYHEKKLLTNYHERIYKRALNPLLR